jgi:Rrf2 family protein
VPVRQIARRARISVAFLAKILGRLVGHGLLVSMKGPRGGVRLARPTSAIKFLEVVEAIDGLAAFQQCVIGFPRCSSTSPCPLHGQWAPLRDGIVEMLSRTALGLIAGGTAGPARSGRQKKSTRAR